VGIYLGIDGGGSKTTCALGDGTSLLATGSAGASNAVRVGEGKAGEALASAIRQACTAAGVSPSQVTRTCIGLAGAAHTEVSNWARQTVSGLVAGEVEVVGDMVIALHAAFFDAPGVIVIAGTGSIAYGRNSQGDVARAGGWGFAISDEGSGHWIGRTAITAALRAEDAETSSPLFKNLLAAWKLSTREQLVKIGNAAPPPDFATLFPIVVKTAESGDSVAFSVLTQAGNELADLAGIVTRKLGMFDSPQVAMSGGVFRHSSQVREVFYNKVRSLHPRSTINPEAVDPVHGALSMARRVQK